MKTLVRIAALATVTAALAAGSVTSSAEAKGFHRGGHGFGHKFGGHRFGGHHFNFGSGHGYNCWKFGKWVCGPRSY